MATPPKKRTTGLIVLIVLVLVVVGGGAAGWFLYLNPRLCNGGPFFDRHGQPSSIPMPSGCMFDTAKNGDVGAGVTVQYWFWTVDGPNNPSALNSFYTHNLPSNGWVQQSDNLKEGGERQLNYCGNGLAMVIDLFNVLQTSGRSPVGPLYITAPPGGSVLAIGTSSDSGLLRECK